MANAKERQAAAGDAVSLDGSSLTIWNSERAVAIEMLCAAQALDCRLTAAAGGDCAGGQPVRLEQLGRGTRAAYRALREAGVAPLVEDRVQAPDIERIAGLIRSRRMARAVDAALAAEQNPSEEDVDGD